MVSLKVHGNLNRESVSKRVHTEWISNGNGTSTEWQWMTKMEKAFARMQATCILQIDIYLILVRPSDLERMTELIILHPF